jgi:hypothetical protein
MPAFAARSFAWSRPSPKNAIKAPRRQASYRLNSAKSKSASVKVISDATYTIVWKIGGSTYEGFGMRLNDSLAATYTINGEPGLVIYKVDGDGLTGAWAVRGHD